ncbi:MAG TPA: hypothetical protein VHO01_04400 [Jatrophihabitans sp.]|nr:hypothetical protein [Jatrophihabitans sp.]
MPTPGDVPNWHATFTATADVQTGTIWAQGALEIFTIEYLRGEVDLLRRHGCTQLRLELGRLIALDQTAANYLRVLAGELAAAGGALMLLNCREPVRSRVQDLL